MTEKKVFSLLISVLFFFLPSCRKSPDGDFRIYRLIDHLRAENIKQSPLVSSFEESNRSSENFFPSTSRPLLDLGAGENPYGIKMKLLVEGVDLNAIFAPPSSEYFYDIPLPRKAVLDFGIGIIRDENSEKYIKDEKKGVNFLVVVEVKGRKKTVFQKYVSLPALEKEWNFSFTRHRIDLPVVPEKARLSLITQGQEGAFSFWYNPVVYTPTENRKNVILISIDTLRADHLGCYGYQRETSPSVDSLVSDSALFLNTYASSPWTLPSHVSLLTSLNGVNHQVYYHDEKMHPSLITLADILRKNEFFCSAFTGGGFVSPLYGFSKGFDIYYKGEGGVYYQDSARLVSNIVSQWLDRNRDKNFFLFIHTYQPHNPYACPPPYKTMFLEEGARWRTLDLIGHLGGKAGIFRKLSEEERENVVGLYDGEIRYTDDRLIKPLLDKLKEMNLYDQTMIIFTSDHGEEFYDHGSWEHGQDLYDESLKVPLVIKFPDSKFNGKKVDSFVRLIDVMPTILEELGIDFSNFSIEGQSLIPLLQNGEIGDRPFMADIGSNVLNSHVPQKITMSFNKYKLILNRKFSQQDLNFFIASPPSIPSVELYDLAEDPFERKNIASEKPEIVSRLTKRIGDTYQRSREKKKAKIEMDEDLKKQLKALGYIR
jgi:arylsulfatase A-like enzyme